MVKQAAKALAPGLRFPEFRDAPGFSPRPLSHAFLRITNGKANAQDHVEGGTYPLFDRSEVVKASNEFLFSSEAVILPGEGMAFRPRHFDGNFNLHQRAYALMECQGHAKFFFYALDYAKDDLALKAVKSTVLSLRLPIIEKFVLYAPGKAEQKRIADCLTSLDEVIAAQGRKVEALKAHKRGLMQQLFPREGETRPRLRFPEFRGAPEWDATSVGAWSKSFSGGTPPTTRADYYGGEIPFIRSAEIGSAKTELSLTQTGLKASSAKLVDAGDVLLALYGANSGDVALAKTPGAINQAILCIRPNGSKAFLYHYLTAIQPWLVATFLQGGQGNLSGEIVKSVGIRVPSSEEQQRIADCLASLDSQITAETARLAALKTHKQGLMQQLFPAPEAD